MLRMFNNLRLYRKISLLGAGSVLITAVALVGLAVWQSGQYNRLAQSEVDSLIDKDLDNITRDIYHLVQTEDEAVQQQVDYNLNVARYFLLKAGGVSLSKDTEAWTVVNQFTSESEKVKLPAMIIGGRRLGRNNDSSTRTPVVDDVTELVGETATIFQRMNPAGDMLRVATTVKTPEGKRAISTYIPVSEPDGSPNPVIESILQGANYHGRAFVLNAWYLTSYEPIKDRKGGVIGMLYVGIQQKKVEARIRQAIIQTKVGKTGYVYVLGGKGEDRGHYIISQNGERDGEGIWDNTDSDGHLVIQKIISKAISLPPGEFGTERYRWQNPGEREPRWKIARLAYYGSWNWVIGTSVYEDELQTYQTFLSDGRIRMTRIMSLAGLIITLLIGLLGFFLSWTIARPVQQMTRAVETIIQGDLSHVIDIHSRDEIGTLARAFNLMTQRLNLTLDGLRQSEEKYRGIFENALEGLFRLSIEGRFMGVNPAMASILGYSSPEELLVDIHNIRQQLFLYPEDKIAIDESLNTAGEIRGKEVQLLKKDQQTIWASFSARMIRDDTGKPLFIDGFLNDITERKQAEAEIKILIKELEDRNAEMTRFTYTVSHDLKSPLITIKGFMGYLEQDAKSGDIERLQADIDRISNAANKMQQLLNELLELSRIGRLTKPSEEIPFGDLAHEAVDMVTGRLLERGVEVDIGPVFPVVYGDRNRLRELIENLLDNAVKFMGNQPHPRVEIGMRREEREIVFYVRDNGVGIALPYLKKVFGLFEKLDAKAEGTGIGLAIAKRVVEVHGGRIWVESDGAGCGATFCFTLPDQREATHAEE